MVDRVLDVLPDGVVLAAEASGAGVHGDALARAVRDGSLVRVRSGAYVRASAWGAAGPEARHRLRVEAAARQLRDPVFSHESAAVEWGLPLVEPSDVVHVLGPRRADGSRRGSGTAAGIARHAAPPGTAVVQHDGLAVTSAVGTVWALAAARDLRTALPVVDRALATGRATAAGLRAECEAAGARRGARRAAVAVDLGDARSESVGESVSRARIHLDGFVPPRLQMGVRDAGGVFARVDFGWPEEGVVGEFDGRVKYRTGGVADRRAVEDRLWAEKTREDRIRATGLRVVRWTWQDVWLPGRLGPRLRAAGIPRR